MPKIEITETANGLSYWQSRPYLSDSVRTAIGSAQVILVPEEGFRDEDVRVFPVCTEDFHLFLKEKLPPDLSVEIAINEDDYKEAALHSVTVIVGGILLYVMTETVAPIVVNLVSEYLKTRLLTENEQSSTNVRWSITLAEGERSVNISYDGPASEFRQEMLGAVARQLSNRPEPPVLPPPHSGDGESGR